MSTRRAVPAFLAIVFALMFFGLGNYLGARQSAGIEERTASLRAEVEFLRRREIQQEAAGTAGRVPPMPAVSTTDNAASRASIIADVKRELTAEMGLLPLTLLRERRNSFVELNAFDDRGASSYGTAGYLGNGYFITVKHAVVALGQDGVADPRKIASVKVMYKGKFLTAKVVDYGDAQAEVDPGDWAILRVKEPVDLPALNLNLAYSFDFAEPIFRLGNDYSKGIILSTGYVGQRTGNNLVTCLTDGHPGVSGGGVLNSEGDLVGIPIGRMQGDYRFSFILPIRSEMLRKVK
ncbi:MAG TPA: serine protease [Vicinamibacterales bacterium]|jgi:S1-C subfamily serine protease|nr:serine protease [Vicinamibacterales bacterium]